MKTALLVLILGAAPADEKPETIWSAGGDGSAAEAWAPDNFESQTTKVKRAAQELLYDLGNQPFVNWGSKRKGAPLNMRLNKVSVPHDVPGVDDDLLFMRFLYFTRGNTEIDIAKSKRKTDVYVKMAVVPMQKSGERTYALHVEARAAQGKARGKVLYAGKRAIQ